MTITRPIQMLSKLLDKEDKVRFFSLIVMMFIAAGLEIIGIGTVTAFIGIITNPEMIQKHQTLQWIYGLTGATSVRQFAIYSAVALFFIFLIKNAYLAFLAYSQTSFALHKEARLSKQLLKVYLTSPYTFHLQRNSADLLKNITVEVSNVVAGIIAPLMILLSETFVLIFILLLLFSVEPVAATLIFAIFGLTSFLFIWVTRPILAKCGQIRSVNAGLLIKWVNQALGSIREIKLAGKEDFFAKKFYECGSTYALAGITATTLQQLPRLIVETLAVTSILMVIIVIHGQDRDLETLLPAITLFALAAMRVMPSVNRMTPAFSQLRYWLPAIEAVYRDLYPSDTQNGKPASTDAADVAPHHESFKTQITLSHVCYRYPNSGEQAVRDVSLIIKRGASVAFMGSSGAGKSTLVELILGLTNPEGGAIMIDDCELADIRESWQRKIGYVSQTIYLMDDTLRRNIAFGIEDEMIDDSRVLATLRTARLDEFVNSLPDGLNTMTGERGLRLSGGERQRLGIARALYHDPEVLVLDEATAALDGETEQAITETLAQLAHAKTIIVIAHRISTVQNCDLIFYIKNGALADSGSYTDLINRNEDFRSMIGTKAIEEKL